MKLIFAALIVYLVMMFGVAGLLEIEWISGLHPAVVGVSVALGGICLAWLATALLNKNIAPSESPASDMTFGNGEDWRFSFRYTTDEALRAEYAVRKEAAERSKLVDGVLIVMGVVWVSLPILTFKTRENLWQPVLSFAIGITVLYGLVLKPMFVRWWIRRTFVPQDVTIQFGDAAVITSTNGQAVTRDWATLWQVLPTSMGIMFYWRSDSDRAITWLPDGFLDGKRDKLLLLIQKKLIEIAAADDSDAAGP